jgi:GT2 family glycosyltransferase
MTVAPLLGLVVIGRNEGERLVRCLQSVAEAQLPVVYVDSGSTDGSRERAAALGAEVLLLDLAQPFTAARARNAGWRHLQQRQPGLRWVQFVDGDCEVAAGWLAAALAHLAQQDGVAVVCGRRRERFPERSVYNQLCDIEWNTPIGPALACGGDAMMRLAALAAVGGYRDDLIAGEEPELCVRLRLAGWQIWRLDAEMTLHDAAMTRLGQWWRRTMRSGHAFAEGAHLHGRGPTGHFRAETRRAALWGLALPLLVALLWWPWRSAAWLLMLAYPLQVLRLGWRHQQAGQPLPWAQAFFMVLGRLPEGLGVARFWWGRWQGARSALIEYK